MAKIFPRTDIDEQIGRLLYWISRTAKGWAFKFFYPDKHGNKLKWRARFYHDERYFTGPQIQIYQITARGVELPDSYVLTPNAMRDLIKEINEVMPCE